MLCSLIVKIQHVKDFHQNGNVMCFFLSVIVLARYGFPISTGTVGPFLCIDLDIFSYTIVVFDLVPRCVIVLFIVLLIYSCRTITSYALKVNLCRCSQKSIN